MTNRWLDVQLYNSNCGHFAQKDWAEEDIITIRYANNTWSLSVGKNFEFERRNLAENKNTILIFSWSPWKPHFPILLTRSWTVQLFRNSHHAPFMITASQHLYWSLLWYTIALCTVDVFMLRSIYMQKYIKGFWRNRLSGVVNTLMASYTDMLLQIV